jgi:farnesyl diphosphate synthase
MLIQIPLFSPSLPQENYGVKSSESEARVKAVFQELELKQKFDEYEAASYERINGLINQIPEQGTEEGLKREVFQSFLAKVYKRVSLFFSLPVYL